MKLLNFEKSIYQTSDIRKKNEFLVQKIQFLAKADSIDFKLQADIDRIDPNYLSDSLRQIFIWNAMLVSFFNRENSLTIYYIESFEKLKTDTSTGFLTLKYLAYLDYDKTIANHLKEQLIVKDSIFYGLECLEEIKDYEIKHKKLKQFSALFPGLGMLLNGYYGKGFISLSLNSATLIAINYLIGGKLYFNALTWGGNLIGKFYIGNVKLTNKLIEKKDLLQKNKLAQTCELTIEKIFSKYPIEFL